MKKQIQLISCLIVALSGVTITKAQTSVFTYQGRLTDASMAASGTYQMQFALFPASGTGAQIGPTLTFDGAGTNPPAVQVANGVFTVQLDFGASPFAAGTDRYLEIAVKHPADASYTTLAPRQQLTASPYSIRTLSASAADSLTSNCVSCVSDAQINAVSGAKVTGTVTNATNATTANTATTADNATKLNNQPASNYVQTSDGRLSDSRAPTSGSGFYIQNQNAVTQTGDFSLSGTAAANIVNATTQYNIGGNRTLSSQGSNLFVGIDAGTANLSIHNTFVGAFAGNANSDGQSNSFFGNGAGKLNVSGDNNAFFGEGAGAKNTAGNNSFFGSNAGPSDTTGDANSFFGAFAGRSLTTAPNNSFFGESAGYSTVANGNNSFFGAEAGFYNTGLRNSFFGAFAGFGNTTGSDNVIIGNTAGNQSVNSTGSFNSFVGSSAGNSNTTGHDNAFLGAFAGSSNTTGLSNSFLGTFAGNSNTTGNFNSFVGTFAGGSNTTGSSNSFIGTAAGNANTTGFNNSFIGLSAGGNNTTGFNNSFVGTYAGSSNTTGDSNSFFGWSSGLSNTTEINNTFIGFASNGAANITNATAIGANASVTQSNSVILGSDANVGIGTSAPGAKLEVRSSNNTVINVNGSSTIGTWLNLQNTSTGGHSWNLISTGSGNVEGAGKLLFNDQTSGGTRMQLDSSSTTIFGNLSVTGTLSKGAGSFKIDHPLDPANKYLYHSFVESPDMMNVYNGNITTDANGDAIVTLPAYFEALNRDFRYQLTVIGQFAQAIVAERVKENQFRIRTDKPNVEVSWQVTGIRKDKFAEDNRIKVEEDKPALLRGECLYEPACQ